MSATFPTAERPEAARTGPIAPRLLFVPVSGAFGMGEYARCLNLALACAARWPAARIHFIISSQARYAATLPFEHTALPSSPTFHSADVAAIIARFEPDAVIFDNAGRTRQLAAAHRAGARLIYISARPRQRRKAFRWRWMRMLDEHWIAYPSFMAGSVSWTERIKLHWLHRPTVRFLDCILPAAAPDRADSVRARAGLHGQRFVLVVPGGGTGHPRAAGAVGVFRQAAQELAARAVHTVFVAPGGPDSDGGEHFRGMELLPLPELLVLLRDAAVVLTNGGDTLIQAIACNIPSVAVAIAADQPARIAHCVRSGVALAVGLDAAQMGAAVRDLLERPETAQRMREHMRSLQLHDGLRESVHALEALLKGRERPALP